MTSEETKQAIEQLKQFAKNWNELYPEEKFEEMKYLATEDVGIANAQNSPTLSGLIYSNKNLISHSELSYLPCKAYNHSPEDDFSTVQTHFPK
jgi:hypothetical protein